MPKSKNDKKEKRRQILKEAIEKDDRFSQTVHDIVSSRRLFDLIAL